MKPCKIYISTFVLKHIYIHGRLHYKHHKALRNRVINANLITTLVSGGASQSFWMKLEFQARQLKSSYKRQLHISNTVERQDGHLGEDFSKLHKVKDTSASHVMLKPFFHLTVIEILQHCFIKHSRSAFQCAMKVLRRIKHFHHSKRGAPLFWLGLARFQDLFKMKRSLQKHITSLNSFDCTVHDWWKTDFFPFRGLSSSTVILSSHSSDCERVHSL